MQFQQGREGAVACSRDLRATHRAHACTFAVAVVAFQPCPTSGHALHDCTRGPCHDEVGRRARQGEGLPPHALTIQLVFFGCFWCFWLFLVVFGCFEVYFLESHRSVIFRIPFRPRSGRRAFATIFCDSGEKVAQLAGSFFSNPFFCNYTFFFCNAVFLDPASWATFSQNSRNSEFELSKMLIFSTQLAGRFCHKSRHNPPYKRARTEGKGIPNSRSYPHQFRTPSSQLQNSAFGTRTGRGRQMPGPV